MNESTVDGPLKCEDCGKVCQGIQGIRGHRRACPGRTQVVRNQIGEPQKPVVQPGKPVVRAPNQQVTVPEPGSRLNADAVDIVLCLHEELQAQRLDLVHELPIRRLMATGPQPEGSPDYEDWYELAKDVVHLEQATDRIVTQARITRDDPWELHKLALTIRERWVSWRRAEVYTAWKQRSPRKDGAEEQPTRNELEDIRTDFGIPELEASWNHVIERFRWLTSHTKATL